VFAGKKRMGEGGGKGLVYISVLRVCFLVSVLVVKCVFPIVNLG